MKKSILFTSIIVFLGLAFVFSTANAAVIDHAKGRFLLQVEDKGQAWYANPANLLKYYLGNESDVLNVLSKVGLGISNSNLNKIPIALLPMPGPDSDHDGLSDDFEWSQGTKSYDQDSDGDGYLDKEEIEHDYSPLNPFPVKTTYNPDFARNLAGKILLQVEARGEAWYVNPDNLHRYYLGRPADAFTVIRELGVGISNNDLAQIATAPDSLSQPSGGQGFEYPLQDLPCRTCDLPYKKVGDQYVLPGGWLRIAKDDYFTCALTEICDMAGYCVDAGRSTVKQIEMNPEKNNIMLAIVEIKWNPNNTSSLLYFTENFGTTWIKKADATRFRISNDDPSLVFVYNGDYNTLVSEEYGTFYINADSYWNRFKIWSF